MTTAPEDDGEFLTFKNPVGVLFIFTCKTASVGIAEAGTVVAADAEVELPITEPAVKLEEAEAVPPASGKGWLAPYASEAAE